MLEILSPVAIDKSPHRRRLAEAGIKGGWNYVLDHAWLFENIERYLRESDNNMPVILDSGCANSMFHPFLEKELAVGIIGIDRVDPHTGRTNIMDLCMDFRQFSQSFPAEMADIVFWLSSIEHNQMEEQRECVEASLRMLKPGGLFLATFGYAPQTHWHEPSKQLNLSAVDAEQVMGTPWQSLPDFEATVAEFRLDLMDLDSRHNQRYGTHDYAFVVAGAAIIRAPTQ